METEKNFVHTDAPRLKFARAIVFFASFCLMTIEIVASRIVAPYLGVSLYTWTGVIATVLFGVTAGNYFGGRIADRTLSKRILGSSLALGGFAAVATVIVTPALGTRIVASGLPLWAMTMLICLIGFFPAAFFLSAISPQIVKFDLHDLERAGVTIGTIGAWSSVGSIFGVFVTGFVFVMYFGTNVLMGIIGASLIAAGIIVASQDAIWKIRLWQPLSRI